jgi:hypothetical protein
MLGIEAQFLGHPTYNLLTMLNTKIPTLCFQALYYGDSTFLSKLVDRKFRNREKKILSTTYFSKYRSIDYELYTLVVFSGSQP